MNPTAIYSKSGKGVQEAAGKTSLLARADRAVLAAIDGRATLQDVAQKVGKAFDPPFQQVIAKLDKDGFIREVSAGTMGAAAAPAKPAAKAPAKPAAKAAQPADPASDLDFSMLGSASKPAPAPAAPARAAAPPPPPKPAAAPPKEQESALFKARQEAEAKAQAERERQRKEAEDKVRAETESKLRAEAEAKARAEAEAKLAAEAEAKVKAAREAAVKAAAEAKAKAEAEARQAREEAERLKKEAEERERKAREEAERVRKEAEERERKAREEAERVRKEAEERERKAREEAERIRREAEEKARREQEELRKRLEEERKAREEAERKAREEAERLRKEAEAEAERVRREAEAEAERERKKLEEERRALDEERRRREDEDRREEEERAARRRAREEEEAREAAEREARRKAREEEEAREEARAAEERAAKKAAKKSRRAEEDEAPAPEPAPAAKAAAAGGGFADSLMADLDSFNTREEEEAKAKEEEERKAKAEAERRAREEAERRAREDAEREAREAKQREKEEKARRKREEEERLRREDEEEKERIRQEEEKRQAEAEERKRKAKEEEALTRKATATTGGGYVSEDARRNRKLEVGRRDPSLVKRKPRSWGRAAALTLFAVLLVALGAVHLMPISTVEYERAASEALGRPVRLGSARLWLFTGLELRIDGGSVGDVKIGRIVAKPGLLSLTDQKKSFSSIELERVSVPQDAIGQVLFANAKADTFEVAKVVARNLELPGQVLLPKDLQGEVLLRADGSVLNAALRGPDGFVARFEPKAGQTIDFSVDAGSFTVPFAPGVTFGQFGMKGTANAQGAQVKEWDGALLDGNVSGTARVRWGGTWVVDGVITARGINAAVFAPALLSEGRGEGTGKFSFSGPEVAKLGPTGRVEGNFTVSKGVLGSFDLSRAIQTSGRQAQGRTPFAEMNGQVYYERGEVELRNVTIGAGALNAGASAVINEKGALSGRIVADVRTASQTLRATLLLGGTVKEPQVRN